MPINRTKRKSICMAKDTKASASTVLGNQGMLKEIKKALMQYKEN